MSGRSLAVHLKLVSVFLFSCHCWTVRFLASSTFTVSPFTLLVFHTVFRSLACRPIGITPQRTNIAELDTVGATLSAAVRCTDVKILNLQLTLKSVIDIINLRLLCVGPPILAISPLSKDVTLAVLVAASRICDEKVSLGSS